MISIVFLCTLAGVANAEKKDLTDYTGIRIRKDDALITMGKSQDIRIFRNAPRELVVDANTVNSGDFNVLGKFMLNGKDLQTIIDAAVAKALKAKGCGCDKDKDKDKPKPPSTFNSFGIVSGVKAPKSNSLTAYKGKSPSGSNGKQYTKAVSTGNNQRPGGYTYTDIVLKGDFVITLRCHDEGGGGDGYIFIGFHEKSYTKYTHARLNGNGGFASDAYWGAYSVPGNKIDVSFDGLNGKESTKYVPKESAGTYYWSWVRKGDTMYTYDSAKAPGNADVTKVMKHRYTFKKKYTGDLRFGFFLHDKNDFVEVYSPGTSVNLA